jgi:hypothetical protein
MSLNKPIKHTSFNLQFQIGWPTWVISRSRQVGRGWGLTCIAWTITPVTTITNKHSLCTYMWRPYPVAAATIEVRFHLVPMPMNNAVQKKLSLKNHCFDLPDITCTLAWNRQFFVFFTFDRHAAVHSQCFSAKNQRLWAVQICMLTIIWGR